MARAAMKLRKAMISATGNSFESSRPANVMLKVHEIHRAIHRLARAKLDMSRRSLAGEFLRD
jgi:hypothetical protein